MARPVEGGAAGARVAGAESGRRLLSVLLSFSERRPLWTVTELSAELGMGTSMIYRYVALLREVGLVDKAENNQYRLTDLAAALAGAATAGRTPIGAVAMPVITRIRDTVDETVLVARRSGWRVYTVDRVESRRPVRLQFEPGRAMDLHTGALSRVLLAAMPAEDRLSFLAQLSAEERARSSLEAGELDRVLADGYAESFEEIDEGIWGVAAPVLADGTVHGALGVAAPLFRTDEARRRSIRELVLAGAGEVSALLQRGTPG